MAENISLDKPDSTSNGPALVQANDLCQGETGPIETESVAGVPDESVASIMSRLVFDWDGTISKEQLEGIPQELVDRVTTPEFVAMAKAAITKARRETRGVVKTGRRESKRRVVSFHPNGSGLNRQQRRRLGVTKD